VFGRRGVGCVGIFNIMTFIQKRIPPVNKLNLISITSLIHHDIIQFDIPVQNIKVRQVPQCSSQLKQNMYYFLRLLMENWLVVSF